MDQVKIGKFIAELRRNKSMTQQQLGDLLGVTNKTVSRWENGNYMPDIETLQLLSKTFHVSINEILSGELLDEADFRKKADENIIAFSKNIAFTVNERSKYLIKKWRKEHIALFILLAVIVAAIVVMPLLFGKPWLSCFAPIVAAAEYGWQNNRMMIYVEKHLYGQKSG